VNLLVFGILEWKASLLLIHCRLIVVTLIIQLFIFGFRQEFITHRVYFSFALVSVVKQSSNINLFYSVFCNS